MTYPKKVTIKEVGPRDGLQNEPVWISTEDKITWINQLSRTGLSYIEITSFVHPKWIPALRDAIDVAKGIDREKGVTYADLSRIKEDWRMHLKEALTRLAFLCPPARRTTEKTSINPLLNPFIYSNK